LFLVIDPLDHASLNDLLTVVELGYSEGVDAVLVGGSVGVQGELLDNVVLAIKDRIPLPVILFPGNVSTLTPHADAVYFMSMLNARSPYWITGAQMLSSLYIKHVGLEVLNTAYVVVEPGGTVGWVGDANLLPRNKPMLAASYALAAQYMGFSFFILDAGSGAPEPVPPSFIKSVKAHSSIFTIAAGGIKTSEQLDALVKAGVDAVQIGTAFERRAAETVKQRLRAFMGVLR
jgi:phosphoglycerol geranylgeranyltransferase